MQHQQRIRWWHRLAICVCLFGFSALAPAIWRSVESGSPPRRWQPAGATQARWATATVRNVPRFPESWQLPTPARLDTVWEGVAESTGPLGPALVDPAMGLTAVRSETIHGRVGQRFFDGEESESELPDDLSETVIHVPAPVAPNHVLVAFQTAPLELKTTLWAMPVALLERLDTLSLQPACSEWATQTLELAQSLGQAEQEEIGLILEQLDEQAKDLNKLLTQIQRGPLSSHLRRVRHALRRRLDIWKSVHRLEKDQVFYVNVSHRLDGLAGHVDKALATTKRSKHWAAWQDYLMLAELKELAMAPAEETGVEFTQRLLRRALIRYESPTLSSQQRRYLRIAALVELKRELMRLTDEPVDPLRVLEEVEAYEASLLPSHGERVASMMGRLERSSNAESRSLAKTLQRHYRAPNLRVSLSQELMTRFVEQPAPETRDVHDVILGTPVFSRATTYTRVRTGFLHSRGRTLLMEIVATGNVHSDSVGRSEMVTAYTHSNSSFVVRRVMAINAYGVRSRPVEVLSVCSNSQLCCMETDVDEVPLLGSVAQSVAVEEYYKQEPQRQQVVRQRIAMRASRRFAERTQPAEERIQENFVDRILVPLKNMDLEPEAVVRPAPGDRTTIRFRLASEQQLAAHTPRPRATAGNLASMQIHESTVNNMIRQFELDGKTFTGRQLLDRVNAKTGADISLKRLKVKGKPDPKRAERLRLTFADKDAVRVRLAKGQIRLTIQLTRMEAGKRSWRNLKVIVPYKLQPAGTTVELHQDGDMQLIAKLTMNNRIAVLGVLSNFFDKDFRYRVLHNLLDNERLSDVRVHQAVIADGWVGVSLGKGESR